VVRVHQLNYSQSLLHIPSWSSQVITISSSAIRFASEVVEMPKRMEKGFSGIG